jgi:hypothetical protein
MTQPPRAAPIRRRLPGALSTAEFLDGVLEQTRARLSAATQHLEGRRQYALVKFYTVENPAIHFELWLHSNRRRVELGLHFETRSADRNQRLLEFVADELMFLKAALGNGIEAELWDKGWTRVYLTRSIDRLDPAEQSQLAQAFAELIETLEPLRQDAIASCP